MHTEPSSATEPPAALLHALLRHTTTAAHAALEDTLALLQPPLQQQRFLQVLAGFHGFHAVWEPALAEALDNPAFTTPRQRLAQLRSDLLALGMPLGAVLALPRCDAAAALCHSRDAALGALYVMEGSTLGGRVIDKQLAQTVWCPAGGLRYFNAHGADTGVRWRETLTLIEHTAHDAQRVADAAVHAFSVLQSWLGTPGHAATGDAASAAATVPATPLSGTRHGSGSARGTAHDGAHGSSLANPDTVQATP